MADNKAKPMVVKPVKPVKSESTDEDYMPPDIKDKLQDMKNKKAAENYEATKRYKEGGNVKSDLAQDKKMAKKAIGMHESQLHGGKKSNLTKLKSGGCTKMARGGGIEVRGKTKGRMV
jgi:hypothetical protein